MPKRIWDQFLSDQDKEIFSASGYGERQGFGKRPALLIIDVNYAFTGERPEPILESIKKWRNSCGAVAWDAVKVIRGLATSARGRGIPVIYTTGIRRVDRWDSGSWSWKNRRSKEIPSAIQHSNNIDGNTIVAELAPEPKDIVVRKQKPSGFFGSPLLSYLILLGCDSVIVTGATTSGCVRATVLDAFSNNLRVSIVEDGCFDRSHVSHAINLYDMDAKYGDVIGAEEALRFFARYPEGQFDLPSGA